MDRREERHEARRSQNRIALCRRHNGFTHGACIKFGQGAWLLHWHADQGADGEDYRADFVRAPFIRHLSTPSTIHAREPRRSSLRNIVCALTLENRRLSSLRNIACVLTPRGIS
jgi:hypothetical protein